MKRSAFAPAVTVTLLLSGCSGRQSALSGDGAESRLIGGLFSGFFWLTLAVYVFVIGYLALAIIRGGRRASQEEADETVAERAWQRGLVLFASATATILLALSTATWLTDRNIARAASGPVLEVKVIGHQWWWEIRYQDPIASREVRSANELVIPANRPVHLSLESPDVIHSLWIPNLAGKQDLIPGRKSDITLKARPGDYRAQCAEFCGLQHAQMALTVSAREPAEFAAWYEAQLAPPVPPAAQTANGLALFVGRQCSSCHNIAGSDASGQVAPDLSHFGSRTTIAAGALPNTPADLRRWIADPQAVKPGTTMPKVSLTPGELDALVTYLETLK